MDAAKKQKLIRGLLIALAALVVLIIAGGITIVASVRSFVGGEQIAEGVFIAGVDVSRLSQSQAVEKLHTKWVPTLPEEIELRCGTYTTASVDSDSGESTDNADNESTDSTSLSPEELGARLQLERAAAEAYRIGREGGIWQQVVAQLRLRRGGLDVPVTCDIDEVVLRSALVALTERINRKPKDATVEVEGDEVHTNPGEVGRSLDIDASQAYLAEQLKDPRLSAVDLVIKTEQPAITDDMVANFETVLSSYSTPFNPGRAQRSHNLKLAMGIVNNTIVQPGEQFSLNEIVGPRLTEHGYKSAPIFLRGEVVPSIGGGVCQVATTLYNVALLANLKVTQRHHHSRPVDYAPSGRDATVYYGQIDLKFTNTLKYPILIIGYAENARLHAKIIGKQEDKFDVELVRSGISSIGFAIKEVPDPELEEGKQEVEKKGRNGRRVTLTRIVKKDGQEIAREVLHADVYRPQTKVIRVGTKKPEEEPEEPVEGEVPATGPATLEPTPPTAATPSPDAPVPPEIAPTTPAEGEN